MSDRNEKDSEALRIFEELKGEIISGEREPGAAFDEEKFAQEKGMDPETVHVAALHLMGEGLLTSRPGRGTIVSYISEEDVRQLNEIRLMIEPPSARIAAEKADKGVMAEWKWYLVAQKESGDFKDGGPLPGGKGLGFFADSDALFHMCVAESTGNRLVVRQMEELMTLTQRIRCLSNIRSRPNMVRTVNEHLAIVEAIIEGKGDCAEEAMRVHLTEVAKSFAALAAEASGEKTD